MRLSMGQKARPDPVFALFLRTLFLRPCFCKLSLHLNLNWHSRILGMLFFTLDGRYIQLWIARLHYTRTSKNGA